MLIEDPYGDVQGLRSYVTNPCNGIGQYGVECGEDEIWTGGTHLGGLDLLVGGKESVGDGALQLISLLACRWRNGGKGDGRRTWNARRIRKTRS